MPISRNKIQYLFLIIGTIGLGLASRSQCMPTLIYHLEQIVHVCITNSSPHDTQLRVLYRLTQDLGWVFDAILN